MRIFPNVFVIIIALIQISVSFAQESNEIKPASPATEMTNSGSTLKEFKQTSIQPLTIEQIRQILPTITGPADKFEFLRTQRKATLDTISNVSILLSTVNAKALLLQSSVEIDRRDGSEFTSERIKSDLTAAKTELEQAQNHLKTLKDSKQTAPDEISRAEETVADTNRWVSNNEVNLKRAEREEKAHNDRNIELTNVLKYRDSLSDNLSSYQRLLGSIDDMVNQLFIASDATNSFKLKMSIAFSALVGVVIIGFFGIAWSNDEIKKIIFANEAGIQFVTIFSIVIAVILFGIIGVLESKELSALLGGLSGYILGKSK